VASDRIQRRIDRLLDQIEQEASQAHWQLVLDLVGEVLDFDPENRDAAAFKIVAERRISSADNDDSQPPSEVVSQPGTISATTAPKPSAGNCSVTSKAPPPSASN